jgi:hypothetical protein
LRFVAPRASLRHDARAKLRYTRTAMDEATEQQLEALRAEHRRLDQQIAAMAEEALVDQLELARMKRRKLQLKDRIQLIVDRNIPDIIA